MRINKIALRAILVYAVYILLLGMLQVTLPGAISILGARPDLTLILAVLSGYMFGQRDGLVIGLFAGFFRDMLAGRAIGLGMLLLMYLGLLASAAFRRFFRRNVLMGFVQVILATVVYQVLTTLMSYILPVLPDVTYSLENLFSHMLKMLPGALLINGAASIPLIFLLYFWGPYQRGRTRDHDDETIVGDSLWQAR